MRVVVISGLHTTGAEVGDRSVGERAFNQALSYYRRLQLKEWILALLDVHNDVRILPFTTLGPLYLAHALRFVYIIEATGRDAYCLHDTTCLAWNSHVCRSFGLHGDLSRCFLDIHQQALNPLPEIYLDDPQMSGQIMSRAELYPTVIMLQ